MGRNVARFSLRRFRPVSLQKQLVKKIQPYRLERNMENIIKLASLDAANITSGRVVLWWPMSVLGH